MEESSSVRSCVGYLYACNESLFKCCNCQNLMSDPVLLKCLHGCCKSCAFEASGVTARHQTPKSYSFVKCAACCEETELLEATPNGLLSNYRRLSALMSELACCDTCDVNNVAALFWCVDCCLGLCESCYTWHNRFNRRHRSADLEVARKWTVPQLIPAAQCHLHKRQIEKHCLTCRSPKCQLCCVDSCRAEEHKLCPLGHDETIRQVAAARITVRTGNERLGRIVSDLQKKCQDAKIRWHGDRKNDGHQMLLQRKKSLNDDIFKLFDSSYGKVLNIMETVCEKYTTTLGRRIKFRETVNLANDIIEELSVGPLEWLKVRTVSNLLKDNVNRCMAAIRKSVSYHRQYWQEKKALTIDGSSPVTSKIVLSSCLGTTEHRRAAPRAPQTFVQTNILFRTPYLCWDVAVTRDELVLLAAAAHGLLVYNDRGQQLSIWTPKKGRNGRDGVSCVTTFSDGRAAVALALTRAVVLLKRTETGDSWQEDGRVTVLQSPPWRLAAHGSLLAVAELRLEVQQQLWVAGRQVKLRMLNSRQLLYTHNRDYDIARIALTALCLVTSSYNPVKRNRGGWTFVVDAFSHSGQFMWSHKASEEECLGGLCAIAGTWTPVYIAAGRKNGSSRVMAIGGADGKDSKDVVNSGSRMRQLPWHLSVARGQRRSILAVVSREKIAGTDQYTQSKTVTLYVEKGE